MIAYLFLQSFNVSFWVFRIINKNIKSQLQYFCVHGILNARCSKELRFLTDGRYYSVKSGSVNSLVKYISGRIICDP